MTHLMRVSKAATGSVVQQSKARWKVMLQERFAAATNVAVVSSSISPLLRRACAGAVMIRVDNTSYAH